MRGNHFCFYHCTHMKRRKKKTKKKKWWLIPVSIVFLLFIYIVIMYWLEEREVTKAKFSVYPAFGISMPLGYQIHGIDVSIYQQYVYWPAVKNTQVENVKIGFVFIKATEGLNNIDKQFKRNWQQAGDAGITRGAYHFFLATKDGKLQAQNFIKNVKLRSGDLPPVLDVEELYSVPPPVMQQRITIWLQTVEAAYHVKPIIYTSADFYQRYLGEAFNQYPLWVAHYYTKNYPNIKRDWWFWQHNDSGKINGIAGSVDFNVFNGDSVEFEKILIK
jgi:lysozyme